MPLFSETHKHRKRKSLLEKDVKKRWKLAFGFGTNIFLLLFVSIYCTDFVHCGQVSPSAVTGLGKTSSSSGGKEGSNSRSSTATDESESSNHHSYHHRNHRHSPHHHTASGKNLPPSSSSVYPSTSAYSGYPEYSGSNVHTSYNSPDAYYEQRHYERPSREFSARSTSYPVMAAAPSSLVGLADTEYGGLALATGHGHGGGHGGHGGHGHGEGYGHGHHTTYYKTVNKIDQSSLGLLGLLGLLSLLSNVLLLLTTTAGATTAAGGGGGMAGGRSEGVMAFRSKRDTMMLVQVKDENDLSRRSVIERLSHLILPSLNVVGHAKDGRIPLNCTYQEVCKTNKVLIQVFGADDGRPVASVMSKAITKLLANKSNKPSNIVRNRGSGASMVVIEKLLTEAGLAGRNGEDCELVYPTCEALSDDHHSSSLKGMKKNGPYRLPLLISPERASTIILGQN